MNMNKRNASMLILTVLILIPTIQYVYAQTLSTLFLSGGVYPQADWTLWVEAGTYYAKDEHGYIPAWAESATYISLLQACHDDLTSGGIIQLSRGNFYDNGVEFNLTNRGITLRGMGYSTKWITNNGATKSPIVVKETDNFHIESFHMRSDIVKTTGAGIALVDSWVAMPASPPDRQACVNSINNLIIENHYEGLRFENTTWVDVENVDIRNPYWKGVVFNYGASFIWLTKTHVWALNASRPNYDVSVHFISAYSIYAVQCEWLNAHQYGVISDPPATVGNAWFKFTQCAVETFENNTQGDAWVFSDSNGGTNEGVYLIDCWGVSAKNGLILQNVMDAVIIGGQYRFNDEHGIWLRGTTSKSLNIDGAKVSVNSRKTDNTYDNIHVDANVSYWSITDCWLFGNNIYGESGNPDVRYGIRVDAGVSNWYQICNNILVDHQSGAISDLGTGTNKTVADNTY